MGKKSLQRGSFYCQQSDCVHGQERTHALFNHVSRDWDKLWSTGRCPCPLQGDWNEMILRVLLTQTMKSVCSPDAHSDLLWPRGSTCYLGLSPASDLPGLNRTMARRHPSSDLSICMSFILDTSSVKTLCVGDMGEQTETSCSTEKHLGQALGIPTILLCRKRHL